MATRPEDIERLDAAQTAVGADPVTWPHSGAMLLESTEVLVGRARAGDRDAYGELFNRFHDEIYRFAARRLGDPSLGQDVAADTFVDAFGALGRFAWRGVPFEAWLYTIARRRIADQMRARTRRARAESQEQAAFHDDHSRGVIDSVDMREMISKLPGAERDVIELRFMEDLDVEQTASRLGKRPGAVRVAQHRALARLRRWMHEVHG